MQFDFDAIDPESDDSSKNYAKNSAQSMCR